MQVAHLVAKLTTMQVPCHVVAKFIPCHRVNFWVRCASGNVLKVGGNVRGGKVSTVAEMGKS